MACRLGPDYYRDRASYDPRINRAYVACVHSRSPDPLRLAILESEARTATAAALERVPPAQYTTSAPFYFSLQTVRQLTSRDLQVIVLAVPASSLHAAPDADGRESYAYRVTASQVGRDSSVAQIDTIIRSSLPVSAPDDATLRTIIEVPAIAGEAVEHRVRVVDLNRDHAGQVYAGAQSIRAFAADRLDMSDLIFTRSVDATTGWRRGDHLLDLLPVQEFRGGTFGLYFELYDAQAGRDIPRQHRDRRGMHLSRASVAAAEFRRADAAG